MFEIKQLKTMSIEIVNGRVFVEGKETVDAAYIGYAVLDAAENSDTIICSYKSIKDLVSKVVETTFAVNETIDEAMKSFKKVG